MDLHRCGHDSRREAVISDEISGKLRDARKSVSATEADLKSQKERLSTKRSAQYDTYTYFKEYQKELRTACANVDSILGKGREQEQERSKSKERS